MFWWKVMVGGCWVVGLSQPVSGLRHGASVPFLTQREVSVPSWSTGVFLYGMQSPGGAFSMAVREELFTCKTWAASPSSLQLCMPWAIGISDFVCGGWCPGGHWWRLFGSLGQMFIAPHFPGWIAGLLWLSDLLNLPHHVAVLWSRGCSSQL